MTLQRVLLTNIYLKDFSGSELNALEIAKELIFQGYQVDVGTFTFDEPLANYFRQAGIPVFPLLSGELNNQHYDLIFANHFPVLTYCLTTAGITADKIVILLNSSIVSLEAPPEYVNQLTFALACNDRLAEILRAGGIRGEKLRVFPNFLSRDEMTVAASPGRELKCLAVVSNHVPQDVYEAAALLRSRGVQVDIFGMADTYQRLTAADLADYDGVVSIGKSVYWALGIGIPAYCYDRFGGPGWITRGNFEKALHHNFSGIGFDQFADSAEDLAEDILGRYSYTLEDISYCRDRIRQQCGLSENLKTLMEEIEQHPPVEDLFEGSAPVFLARRNLAIVELYANAINLRKEISYMKKRNLEMQSQNLFQSAHIEEIKNTRGWKFLEVFRRVFRPFFKWQQKRKARLNPEL